MTDEQRIEKAKKVLASILEGCRNVKEEEGLHKDAKDLARLVIKDCNKTISALEGRAWPGDE